MRRSDTSQAGVRILNSPERNDRRAIGALLLVQLLFGLFPVLGKIALAEMPPLVLASFRAVFGSLCLSVLARLLVPEVSKPDARERRTLMVLALLGIVANQILFIVGLSKSTATNATILVMAIPVFTLMAALVTRAERLTWTRALGIPFAAAGLLTFLDLGSVRFGSQTLTGDLLMTLNAVFYSVYLVASRRVLASRPAIDFTARVFRYGAVPILLIALPSLIRLDFQSVSLRAWGAVVGIVLLPTVGAYFLNAWALARTSASTTAFFVFVQPIFATSLAWVVLGERPARSSILGGLLIGVGTLLTIWPRKDSVPSA